jgi:hypothetical protein
MEPSSFWEAKSCSAGEEIPITLWNLMGYYRVHKSPLQVYVLSQMNPVYTHPFLYGPF